MACGLRSCGSWALGLRQAQQLGGMGFITPPCTTTDLSIHSLMDIWTAAPFGYYASSSYERVLHIYLFKDLFSIILDMYLTV